MADFANFGFKIYNGSEAFIKALEKMDEKQNEFLLEEDSFMELLDEWLENPNNVDREVTAMDLVSDSIYWARTSSWISDTNHQKH